MHGNQFRPGVFCRKSCSENITKLTEKHLYNYFYFDNAVRSRPGRFQSIPNFQQVYLMSLGICISSYLIYGQKRLTTTTTTTTNVNFKKCFL